MSEEAKISLIRAFLENPECAKMTNREIGSRFSCDEGTVRRARKPAFSALQAEVLVLRERVAELEKLCKPRVKRVKPEPLRELWERNEDGDYVPTIPMIEADTK